MAALNTELQTELLHTLHLMPQPSGYWIAFSGGMDSTCLIHAMAQLQDQLAIPIYAIHIDHGLQTISGQWALHCQQLCNELNIALQIHSLKLKPVSGASIEAIAREARLETFRKHLTANAMLLTAQHQHDQAETLVLQLLRGSGLAGLAAMPKIMPYGLGWLARPFLEIPQAQLAAYAQLNRLKWIEDPTNTETSFARNYLRHCMFPVVAQRWPAYERTIARSAKHCAAALDLLNDLLAPYLAQSKGMYPGTLSIKTLMGFKPNLCRAILRLWIQEQGFILPDTKHLERIRCELMIAAPDRNPVVLWHQTEVRRYRDDIFIHPPLPYPPATAILWHPEQALIDFICNLPDGLGSLSLIPTKGIGINPILWKQSRITVHFGITGLQCRLPHSPHKRTLKDIYQEYAIPSWLRPYIPLVYLDDTLIAIANICLCNQSAHTTNLVTQQGFKIVWEINTAPFNWLFNNQQATQ